MQMPARSTSLDNVEKGGLTLVYIEFNDSCELIATLSGMLNSVMLFWYEIIREEKDGK